MTIYEAHCFMIRRGLTPVNVKIEDESGECETEPVLGMLISGFHDELGYWHRTLNASQMDKIVFDPDDQWKLTIYWKRGRVEEINDAWMWVV